MSAPTATEFELLPAVGELDRLVFTDYGRQEHLQDDAQLRLRIVRESLAGHLDRCPVYASFAAHLGFALDSLEQPDDLDRVPQFPTGAFKSAAVLSVPVERTAKRCTSSGTRGRVSVVHRDRLTIERLLGSARRGLELFGEWYEDEVRILNLGPDPAETGDLWFAYVMSLIGVDYATRHAVVDGEFDPRRALSELERIAADTAFPVLAGPPTLVLAVARAALERGVAIPQLAIFTAGGWKRQDSKRVDRNAFGELIVRAFKLEDDRRVRDAFNQVELNTVMVECHRHRKHVPPWLHVTTRSLRTLEPLAHGERGLLSYLDPSAVSYPCFIVADDVGDVSAGPCECGWPGRTLHIERRLERNESWGCALKMDRAWGAEGR